jgi:lysophospholipase L1-like esterase
MEETTNRFTVRLTASAACEGVAGVLLLSSVMMAHPIASILFATNGRDLRPGMVAAIGLVQTAAGVLGLACWVAAALLRSSDRRLPIRRGHIVALALAAAVAVVTTEVLLRVRGVLEWGSGLRTPLPWSAMRPGEELYLRPGCYAQEVSSDFEPGRRRVVVATVNRFGLRGSAPLQPERAGRYRVVALGGSTTFGYTVTDGEEWPVRLEVAFGGRAEVLNAGRPGATTFRNFTYLRDRLSQLRPDAVILYEGFNDLWRAVRRHRGEQRDYGRVDDGLPATPEVLDLGPPQLWPLRPSFLAFHLGAWVNGRFGDPTPSRDALGSDEPFVLDPAIARIYSHNLRAMIALCREQGSRPVVATFAAAADPSRPPSERRLRLKYVLDNVPQLDVVRAEGAIETYRELTREAARGEGAILVDLAVAFGRDPAHFADTVHFTPTGEQRVADLLAQSLRDIEPRLR